MAKNSIYTPIVNAVERYILSRVKSNSLFGEYYKRSEKGRADWKRQSTVFDRKEIKDWRMAVMAATDPENPRRGMLMRFYESLMLDMHLGSCIDNRILPIQCAAFKLVDKNDDEDYEAHKLLEKPWFIELIRYTLMHQFEGTKLIEMFKLNEKGELSEVSEIPQSNFLPQKGIVIREEYDDEGVSYRDGAYKDFYVQVGGDWNLGMLSQVAMIVLAKKLGLGSWLSYIEKYGVPPIFAITERMDSGRRDELFEMLENFRMNHFAVLQGQEKIEIPNNYNVDAYQSFKSLLKDVADNEISKRFLGGSGITDEKSFVGSAEVQERLLKYRHQVDKLYFKFYMNEEYIPRLVKLSSVYAPLANLYFEFDETETLTLKQIIEAIKELSQYYVFDAEEVARITGLPILEVKSVLNPNQPPVSAQKKNFSLKGFKFAPLAKAIGNPFAATWDAATERLAKKIYKGEVKPTDLDRDIVLKNYAALNKESGSGWGEGYYESDRTRPMRENLLRFAGAKCHNLMTKLSDLSKEKTSEQEFIEAAKSTVLLHNNTYLEVEKKFAANSASSARNFEDYLGDADIYPNLKNRTMGDDDVRHSHELNEGIIKPINEWKQIPPYDPGCRCWLEQTNEPPTDGRTMQNLDNKWANNAYLSGEIFVEKHNYFDTLSNSGQIAKNLVKDNTEVMKQFMPYNRVVNSGDNKVYVNDFYDIKDGNLALDKALIVSKGIGEDIYILPHIENSDKLHKKNPEYAIGKSGHLADLKTYDPNKKDAPKNTRNFVRNSIDSANEQGCTSVVLDLSLSPESNYLVMAANKLRGELNEGNKTRIKRAIIIRDDKVLSVSRKEITKDNYLDYFKFE
jgi:hypothetical protein